MFRRLGSRARARSRGVDRDLGFVEKDLGLEIIFLMNRWRSGGVS